MFLVERARRHLHMSVRDLNLSRFFFFVRTATPEFAAASRNHLISNSISQLNHPGDSKESDISDYLDDSFNEYEPSSETTSIEPKEENRLFRLAFVCFVIILIASGLHYYFFDIQLEKEQILNLVSMLILGGLSALYYYAYRFYQDVFYVYLSLGWLSNSVYLFFELVKSPNQNYPLDYHLSIYGLSLGATLLFHLSCFVYKDKTVEYRNLIVSTFGWIAFLSITFLIGYWLVKNDWTDMDEEKKFMIVSFGGVPFSIWTLRNVGRHLWSRVGPDNHAKSAYVLKYTFYTYAALQPLYLLKLIPENLLISSIVASAFFIALLLKTINGIAIMKVITNDSFTQAETIITKERLKRRSTLEDLGVLTASIQHDIRNPLGVIETEIKTMRRKFQSHQDILAALNKIDGQRRRIFATTKFIPILRGGRGFYERYMEKTSVGELVRGSIKAVQAEPQSSNINFKTNDAVFFTKALRPVLGEAIVNLLKNAVEAIHEADRQRGLVNIEIKSDPKSAKRIKIDVIDNGCGIPEENISKLTTLFTTRKTKKANSGIGLFITDRIIKMHHGEMTFQSKVGEGTTVSLYLPKWDPEG